MTTSPEKKTFPVICSSKLRKLDVHDYFITSLPTSFILSEAFAFKCDKSVIGLGLIKNDVID